MAEAKRFRWQVIPGTLLLIFGSVGLISGPAMSYFIWSGHQRGIEKFAGADVPLLCIYILAACIFYSVVSIAAAIQWFRGRNKAALFLTALAIAAYAVLANWTTSRHA
jgi:hypothetical protein